MEYPAQLSHGVFGSHSTIVDGQHRISGGPERRHIIDYYLPAVSVYYLHRLRAAQAISWAVTPAPPLVLGTFRHGDQHRGHGIPAACFCICILSLVHSCHA